MNYFCCWLSLLDHNGLLRRQKRSEDEEGDEGKPIIEMDKKRKQIENRIQDMLRLLLQRKYRRKKIWEEQSPENKQPNKQNITELIHKIIIATLVRVPTVVFCKYGRE